MNQPGNMKAAATSMQSVFANPDPGVILSNLSSKEGHFYYAHAKEPRTRLNWRLGAISGVKKFIACSRKSPWWMVPCQGQSLAQVPVETQFILIKLDAGDYLLIVPLLDASMRFSLTGSQDGLLLVGETGDAYHGASGGLAMYVARGEDPYALAKQGSQAVAATLPECRLRKDRRPPDFMDRFGWCTWDAFYHEVNPQKIESGLSSLEAAGAAIGFLIIDDGWQSIARKANGEAVLTSFSANEKFAGSLRPVIDMAKNTYGVHRVLVWHNVVGYWGGVDPGRFNTYDCETLTRNFGQGMLEVAPGSNNPVWGQVVTRPSSGDIGRFYDDYHDFMRKEGVDGVKIDSQAVLESVADKTGGRVALTRSYRLAMEQSVERHFSGRLINCMSQGTESWYHSGSSYLNRGSDDFWPNDHLSHGLHLWVNAVNGLWFGNFHQLDWDMFHSLHPMGWFHAASRAISGGPVYVSDKPGMHDPAVLRALAMSGGRIPRPSSCAMPGRSSLFMDSAMLTVVNANRHGSVVGVFNTNLQGDSEHIRIDGGELPEKEEGLVAYGFRSGTVSCGGLSLSLKPLEWEVVTLAPAINGMAIFGLAELINSGGAINRMQWHDGICHIELGDGGRLVGYARNNPRIISGALERDLKWDDASGRFEIELRGDGIHVLAMGL